jgi:hypothetical protein
MYTPTARFFFLSSSNSFMSFVAAVEDVDGDRYAEEGEGYAEDQLQYSYN